MSSLLPPYPVPVFKSGAVLKHSDLNAIVSYLENQIKASRRYLDGFGIVEGMEVRYATTNGIREMEILPGVAVMPSGQLIEIEAGIYKFTSTKKVDSKLTEDLAFSKCFGEDVVELVAKGGDTPLAVDEKRCVFVCVINGETAPKEMLNSCVRQSDVNEHKTVELKFFLGAPVAETLGNTPLCFTSPCLGHLTGEQLTERNGLEALTGLSKKGSGLIPLGIKEIQTAYMTVRSCFPDVFCDKDFGNWAERLLKLADPNYPFYVYDYLKTLIAAYNEFLQLDYLKGPYSKAAQSKCPEFLSLGQSGKYCGCRQYWQSALVRADERAEAVFYAQRMIALTEIDIRSLEATPVHLTPSSSDRFPLSRRAIPFYFNHEKIAPLWNYQMSLQGLDDTIPHYDMDFCENHLCYKEASDFIRVEGHIGTSLNSTVTDIEACRKRLNLPFSVIALEVDEEGTAVLPLWQPHFDDLERSFQIQRSYFLAAMDIVYNATPQINKDTVKYLVEMAEQATCYQDFNYHSFIKQIGYFIDSQNPYGVLSILPTSTFTNAFDGLKIIFRSKQARLRQLFLDRFLHCHEGFDLMCGVPKGGTLAILYKRHEAHEPVREVTEGSEQAGEKVMVAPKLSGVVVGDLAIPCCDVDLTQTPVAVFSVSMRHEVEPNDIPTAESETMGDNYFQVNRTRFAGVTVTLRNLSLHYDELLWKIEALDKNEVATDITSEWQSVGCDNMTQYFDWPKDIRIFEQETFRATLTVKKCGKMDEYQEDFKVRVPGKLKPEDGQPQEVAREKRSVQTSKAARNIPAPVAEAASPDFTKTLRQRQHDYKTVVTMMEADKIINNNKAFNTVVKPFVFFPKTKAAFHQQFVETGSELMREIAETKDAKRLEKYTKLLQTATYHYLDKIVQNEDQVNEDIRIQVLMIRVLLAEKGITPADFTAQWKIQKEVSLPESNPVVQSILAMLDTP